LLPDPPRHEETSGLEKRQRQRRLIFDTILLGIAGAVAAQLFMYLLKVMNALFLSRFAGYVPPGAPSEGGVLREMVGPHGLWLVPVSTALGGLIVGILIDKFAPEAEGHGTGAALRAFHRAEGFLRARVPPLKLLASAITIGSGGSAGREGPIALVTAGVGSWYATITHRSDRDRRLLLITGMAAGLSAIFRSPIGTALFAIEVPYLEMEFESAALLYAMLAAIVAYAINGLVVGWSPLFEIPSHLQHPAFADYAWYTALGVAAGLIATLFPICFYGTRDLFRKIPIKPFLKPAVGGLGMGLIAVALPQVIGGGYGWIQEAIDGRLVLGTLAALIFAKMLAMSLTVSSGGSGGVFAPSLFIGAMLGGLFADVFHQPSTPFVIVGMAAVFAGAAHVPIASLMMVTEMTSGYTLLVPAALAVTLSYLVQMRLSRGFRHRSLYEAQVPSRGDSPAHHAEHLQIALRILEERNVPIPESVGRVDLLSFLRSGIPVELADNRRLLIGVLRKKSSIAEKTLKDAREDLGVNTLIIAIIRDEHMMVPRGDTALKAGDRMILLTTAEGMEKLKADVDPW
jgi:CIC family chloride channel protein